MFQSLFQGVMIALVLFAAPFLIGNGICSILELEKTIAKNYFFGMVTIWALFQLISVPLVLLRASFMIVVVLMTILIIMLTIYGMYKGRFPRIRFEIHRKMDLVAAGLMSFGMFTIILCTIFMQHTDWDDSRFVVNAVDMVRTNRMFLTNPMSGQEAPTWIGEIAKDVTAPWAVFIAYCAKMTGVFATVMAHTVLPVVLLICAFCVFWMLSEVFFKADLYHRSIFMYLVILLNLYGHFSIYSSETFLLTRLWQGKAVVAGVGIPAIFLVLMWIYENKKRKSHMVLLVLLNLSICLMSGMGTIIGVMMLGCTGLVYGILKGDKKLALTLWTMCIPNILYFIIHSLL